MEKTEDEDRSIEVTEMGVSLKTVYCKYCRHKLNGTELKNVEQVCVVCTVIMKVTGIRYSCQRCGTVTILKNGCKKCQVYKGIWNLDYLFVVKKKEKHKLFNLMTVVSLAKVNLLKRGPVDLTPYLTEDRNIVRVCLYLKDPDSFTWRDVDGDPICRVCKNNCNGIGARNSSKYNGIGARNSSKCCNCYGKKNMGVGFCQLCLSKRLADMRTRVSFLTEMRHGLCDQTTTATTAGWTNDYCLHEERTYNRKDGTANHYYDGKHIGSA